MLVVTQKKLFYYIDRQSKLIEKCLPNFISQNWITFKIIISKASSVINISWYLHKRFEVKSRKI